MAFTQITTSNLDNTITTKLAAAEAANAAVANIVSLAISSVQIADSSYNVIDDTAANTGGGYLIINGTGFTNQCVVIVGTTNATSTTFANTKQLRAQVPGLAAATYPLYVVDSVTGATAIKVNGLTYSSFPAWSTGSTLSNQSSNAAFSVSLSANSDSAITYSNTTTLPAGTTLAANGLFSGTVSIGAQTTYSFDVKATDAENQDATRTFSLTVTVIPQTRLWMWGNNNYGKLGLGDRVYKSSPTQVGTAINWNTITSVGVNSSDTHVVATKTDGTAWTWGRNSHGQLGLNDRTVHRSSPVQIGTDTNWNLIKPGQLHTLAIKTNGTLWAWGIPNDGRLGLDSSQGVYRSSPVQVGTDTTWSNVSSAEKFNIATKTNNTLWSWGANGEGQLGRNNTTYTSSPVQISGSTWSQTAFAVGRTWCLAVKTDGTLWGWGNNHQGNLGVGNTVNRSSPTQIGTNTNWSLVSCGNYTSAAIKTDGTLWLWGYNAYGQLGQNDANISKSSPTQVGTGTNWSQVSGGTQHVLAIKTDGTLWTWGSSSSGAQGRNDNVQRSSPVQIGTGTNWSKISAGMIHSSAITAN